MDFSKIFFDNNSNNKIKVLLVEDEEGDQLAFKYFVNENNLPYEYYITDNLETSKQLIKDIDFDIIIADYLLKDSTAFDILNLNLNIPVIIVTASGNEEVAVKAIQAGAYDYIIKDLEQNYLKTLPLTVKNTISRFRIEKKIQILTQSLMNIYDNVFITTLDNKFIYVNESFKKTYGYSDEDIIGKNIECICSDNFFEKYITEIFPQIKENNFWRGECMHKNKNGEKIPILLTISYVRDFDNMPVALVGVSKDIIEKKKMEEEREKLINDLQEAMKKIKVLKGFIPICANCKNVRDDAGYWQQVEEYIRTHSEAEFTHSLCPKCSKLLYPDLNINNT